MQISRRAIFGGLVALAAPAIIRTPGLLMPIQAQPERFLPCDGRLIPRRLYGDLFRAIGTIYGGDGMWFNLPNLRDYPDSHVPMTMRGVYHAIATTSDAIVPTGAILMRGEVNA
jgi:microcystin-dependent protein